MNIEEAKKLAAKQRPWLNVKKATEFDDFFLVILVPKDDEDGSFIGGGTRVDKKTGKCTLYNPLLENDS